MRLSIYCINEVIDLSEIRSVGYITLKSAKVCTVNVNSSIDYLIDRTDINLRERKDI